jgi:glycosyltransferase involved in cell wall biosynthesis
MNIAPLVSVLVPNYNHEKYLPLRIESILNQTFNNFELILMDDCSSDGSVAILEHYAAKDSRVTVVINKQNSGSTFLQWKKGIELSKGKYIWIAESDDFAEVSFLTELVLVLENDTSLVLAYSNSNIVDAQNKADGTTADWKNNNFQTNHWSFNFLVSGKEELEKYLSTTCTINNASSVVFRRAV